MKHFKGCFQIFFLQWICSSESIEHTQADVKSLSYSGAISNM